MKNFVTPLFPLPVVILLLGWAAALPAPAQPLKVNSFT